MSTESWKDQLTGQKEPSAEELEEVAAQRWKRERNPRERKQGKGYGKEIKIELSEGGSVTLQMPGGNRLVVEAPKSLPKDIDDTELTALTAMKLTVPVAFPEETTGVDQAGFRTGMESNVSHLPSSREEDYRNAIGWAGATLQRKGWPVDKVLEIVLSDYRNTIEPGVHLGSIGKSELNIKAAKLRRVIVEAYPGAGAAIRRGREKKIPDW
jgi:hypothetical protein